MMMSEPETPILTVRVDAATIPVSGHEIRLEASQSQCEALASAYNLVGVKSLCATLKVEKRNRGAFVSGRIVAEIVQNCVITLEPVMQSIDEQVEVEFMAAGGHGRPPQVDV